MSHRGGGGAEKGKKSAYYLNWPLSYNIEGWKSGLEGSELNSGLKGRGFESRLIQF